MAYSFDTYSVDIVDRPFVRADGYTTPQTATIILFNEKGREIQAFNLACPDISDIYDSIGREENINLDSCYVKGFSSTACKRYLIIDKLSYLSIKGFSAKGAFFDSTLNIDFSLVEFTDNTSFNDSYIVSKAFDFHSSKLSMHGFDFANCFVKSDKVNFTQTQFAGGIITFKNTMFDTGDKDFQDIDFGNGEVVFTNTEFGNGNVSFINARFNDGDASFKFTRFGEGKVDFHYAKFGKGNITFEQAEFGNGRTDFRTVEFGTGRTSFNRCVFGIGEVTFEGAQAKQGKVTFKRALFGNSIVNFELFEGIDSYLIFERSTFNADVSFRGAFIKELHIDDCQFNSTLKLHVDICQTINLSGCIFRDIVDFWTHGDVPKVKVLNLSGVRLLGILYLDWESNDVKKLIYSQTGTDYRDKAEQFRVIKQNFNNTGQYDDEDLAYVEFKRNEAKAILSESLQKEKRSALWQYPAYGFKKLVFDWMGLYATSPLRVVFSNIVMIFTFALIYTVVPYFADTTITGFQPGDSFMTRYLTAAYYAAITYFTVGYGEIVPVGVLRLVAVSSAFIGVFMMSYFTVAFVRKILR
ncbi:MAG: potassium channel family protein [Bacteroidales bacterium]